MPKRTNFVFEDLVVLRVAATRKGHVVRGNLNSRLWLHEVRQALKRPEYQDRKRHPRSETGAALQTVHKTVWENLRRRVHDEAEACGSRCSVNLGRQACIPHVRGGFEYRTKRINEY